MLTAMTDAPTDAPPPPFTAGWVVDDEGGTAKVAAEARRLASAIRRANAPSADLSRARELIAEASALLESHHVEGMPMQGRVGPNGPTGMSQDPVEFFPWSPIIGPLSPISGDMTLDFDAAAERMRGRANFDAKHNGPPGMVHGGVIALAFDELLGTTNVCLGLGGFTGTLSVRYEKPTWVDTEIQLEAWIDRVEGRKVFTVGTMSIDGTVTARAEGIFITTTMWRKSDD